MNESQMVRNTVWTLIAPLSTKIFYPTERALTFFLGSAITSVLRLPYIYSICRSRNLILVNLKRIVTDTIFETCYQGRII